MKAFLSKFFNEKKIEYSLVCYNNGEEFLKEYQKGASLIFMDIEFGKERMNGMDVSRQLRKIDEEVLLVFVTNMAQFAIDGYEVDALDFIVKPMNYFSFTLKMEKVLRILGSHHNSKNVMVSVENGTRNIFASEILYVEVSNHDLYYHTKNHEYKVRMSMREAMDQLKGLPFSRCNVCYLVNLAHVESADKDSVLLTNGESLKMPRTRRKEFLSDLGRYLSGGGLIKAYVFWNNQYHQPSACVGNLHRVLFVCSTGL